MIIDWKKKKTRKSWHHAFCHMWKFRTKKKVCFPEELDFFLLTESHTYLTHPGFLFILAARKQRASFKKCCQSNYKSLYGKHGGIPSSITLSQIYVCICIYTCAKSSLGEIGTKVLVGEFLIQRDWNGHTLHYIWTYLLIFYMWFYLTFWELKYCLLCDYLLWIIGSDHTRVGGGMLSLEEISLSTDSPKKGSTLEQTIKTVYSLDSTSCQWSPKFQHHLLKI